MAPLHPELARLEAQYNGLIDQVQAQNLSYNDALVTLASLSIVDGAGAQWGINVDGDFTRMSEPGGAAKPADPAGFVPPQLPQRPGAPSAPWNNPDLMQPPADVAHNDNPMFPMPAQPTAGIPRGRALPDDTEGRSVGRLGELLAKLPGGGSLAGNKRLIIIVVVCVLVLGFIVTRGGDDGAPAGPGTTATETDAPAPLPTDVPATIGTIPVAPAPAPNPDEVASALSALTSGDRNLVAGVVNGLTDEAAIAVTTASFAGIERSGLTILADAPAATATGADQTLNLVDTATSASYARATVSWVRVEGGGWKLTAAPSFAIG